MMSKKRLKKTHPPPPPILASIKPHGKHKQYEDRLSNLPDPILEQILSHLQTLESIRTTILSSRFRRLWSHTPVLDLDIRPFNLPLRQQNNNPAAVVVTAAETLERFMAFTNRALMLHKRETLEKFRLDLFDLVSNLHDRNGEELFWLRDQAIVDADAWIRYAVSRDPKVLCLSLTWPGENRMPLPCCVWGCESIVEMHLRICEVEAIGWIGVRMRSLKILSLEMVVMDDKTLEEVVCGCPRLEELTIQTYHFKRIGFRAPCVKLILMDYDCDDKVTIDCPNLKSFEYYGCAYDLDLVNISSLESAMLDVEFDSVEEFSAFMMKLRHVQKVKLRMRGYIEGKLEISGC